MQKIIPFITRFVSKSDKHHKKGPMFTMGKINRMMSIREHRKIAGLTIREAAHLIDIHVDDLMNFEADSRDAPCSIALKLCRLYSITTVDQFYVGVDPIAKAFKNYRLASQTLPTKLPT